MYSAIVGGMKFSPSEFWNMTLHEAFLVIEGDRDRQENDFFLFYFAHTNALGACLSKNHKFTNPFEKKGKKPKESSAEELKEDLADLIKNWR